MWTITSQACRKNIFPLQSLCESRHANWRRSLEGIDGVLVPQLQEKLYAHLADQGNKWLMEPIKLISCHPAKAPENRGFYVPSTQDSSTVLSLYLAAS